MKLQHLAFGFCMTFILTACSTSQTASSEKKSSGSYQGLGRESVDEKTIAQYAAPSLPQDLSRKIQNFLDIRSPGLGMLSPDKKNLYFTWRVTGTSQVWKLDRPKAFPVQLTGGEDSTTIAGQTPNGKWLLISRDRNGEENPGLYLQSAEGGPLKLIQHKAKVQTFFQAALSDSKTIIYRANDVKPDSYTFYRYDIESARSEAILSQDGYWSLSDFKDDGRILFTKAITNTATEVYEWDPKSKQLRPILGQGEKNEFQVQYSARDGEFLVLTPKLGEFRRLYTWDGKKLSPITAEMKWDVADFGIDFSRKQIVYTVNEAGYTKAHALDAKTLKPIEFPKFPDADQIYIAQLTRDGSHAMIGVETSKGPRVSYSYNFKTKLLTQWVVPSQPEVRTDTFAKASLEYYTTRDGTKIPMFVRRPAFCQGKNLESPCPVVVHFHGGPEGQTTPGFSIFAQLFVDEGMIFVEPNVRGSDGYGKTWLDIDNGPKRLNVIADIEDAALFIKKNWAVQGKSPKVGVMGWSYGGYSTLVAMTMFAGSYDAGVALVGMSDLLTFLNNTAPYRRALRTPEYGDPVKDKEALIKLSPVTYLDRVKNPLMIVQGANDPRVPVGEAIQIHKLLESKKIPSSLIIFADEGHGTDKRSNKVLELGHAMGFLKKNL
ncbi:MAG: prolyl oligopeptidase family serine peptidase [Pseudobdellovibrionaceae bacterium]